ncbi:MAG: ParB N-terminal domain-containing protein [Clostridia bacterium]|nr:ParB N-terminal domain-containing protein [Clostridia bacterium]
MAGGNTRFQEFLAQEVKKYKGIYVPVKAGLLKRVFVREVPLKKIHPNPDDEFCAPEVGPNNEIVSRYMQVFADNHLHHMKHYCEDPVLIEKIRPGGYMILNGHHRWAAALRLGYKRIATRTVNLTGEMDVKLMLQNSVHTRRATLDLDEVVFAKDGSVPAEKELPFPFSKLYRERLRLGVPALFRLLNREGWDVWVYTSQYYSPEYIRRLFRKYHVRVTGVVTGAARKTGNDSAAGLEKLVKDKYQSTLHIDSETVLFTRADGGEFEDLRLPGESVWSAEVMEIVRRLKPHE